MNDESVRPDPQWSLLDAMTEAEVLDMLGPSWSSMSPKARLTLYAMPEVNPKPQPCPALALWRAAVARGDRTPMLLDALWRAACAESNANEAAAAGLGNAATAF